MEPGTIGTLKETSTINGKEYYLIEWNTDRTTNTDFATLVEYATEMSPTQQPSASPTRASDLFISEYGEASDSKYVEFYNPTGATVQLDEYRLGKVSNAPTTRGAPDNIILFTKDATIEPGRTYVLCASSTNAARKLRCDQVSGSINHNGNDGYCLLTGGEHPTKIDCVGDFEGAPGIGWSVCGEPDATLDHTLIRKSFAVRGNSNWAVSSAEGATCEWNVYDTVNWTNVGVHNGTL
jgi:hypothetical protein